MSAGSFWSDRMGRSPGAVMRYLGIVPGWWTRFEAPEDLPCTRKDERGARFEQRILRQVRREPIIDCRGINFGIRIRRKSPLAM
jgi:hypothetical protein